MLEEVLDDVVLEVDCDVLAAALVVELVVFEPLPPPPPQPASSATVTAAAIAEVLILRDMRLPPLDFGARDVVGARLAV
jgi:hypothetical protein